MTVSELLSQIGEIVKREGRFVSSFEVRDGKIVNYELAPFGPGDLVLDVSNGACRICRAIWNPVLGAVLYPPVHSSRSARFLEWCSRNCDAAGGMISINGHYPIVIPTPKWLKTALGRALSNRRS